MLKGNDAANALALRVLEPLKAYYGRADIEEIAINRPGEVWIKPRRRPWVREEAEELTYEYIAQRVCKVLANINRARFNENDVPVVSCELPGLPFRFQAMVGANVRYDIQDRKGVAVAIRSLESDTSIGMDTFVPPGIDLPGMQRLIEEMSGELDHVQKIQSAVDRGMSIMVSGATSSGKTTFMKQMIKLIDPQARVVTVEDVRELDVPHANRVHLMVPRNAGTNAVGWSEILDALVRMTPDYILCGEISVKNAASVYGLMSKGHPVWSTVHASTPEEAMRSIVNNMSASGSNLNPDATMETLRAQIGCVIQLDRFDGQRRVVDISFPALDHQRALRDADGGPAHTA